MAKAPTVSTRVVKSPEDIIELMSLGMSIRAEVCWLLGPGNALLLSGVRLVEGWLCSHLVVPLTALISFSFRSEPRILMSTQVGHIS